MSEIRMGFADNKIKIEADSNSLSTLYTVAQSLMNHIEVELDKVDSSKFGPKDLKAWNFLRDEVQVFGEDLSSVENDFEAFETETDLDFFYKDKVKV